MSDSTCLTYERPPINDPGNDRNPPPPRKFTRCATGVATTRSRSSLLPPRVINAAWPGNKPSVGELIAAVKPASRHFSTRPSSASPSATATHGVVPGRSSGPRIVGPPPPPKPPPPGLPPESLSCFCPIVVIASIRPGKTVKPSPSTTHASAGTSTAVPTAAISPSATRTVAPSTGAPAPETTRTFSIA